MDSIVIPDYIKRLPEDIAGLAMMVYTEIIID